MDESEMTKGTGPKRGSQFEFRQKAASAFLATATDPNAPFDKLTGSLPDLRQKLGRSVNQLAHIGSAKPYGGMPTLSIVGNKWAMTPYGAERYWDYLVAASKGASTTTSDDQPCPPKTPRAPKAKPLELEVTLNSGEPGPSLTEIVAKGETADVEFKSTLRTNLRTGEKDAKIELMVLKTVAGFLNTKGGTLVIGISDDGSPVGLQSDGFPNEDKMALHLVNLLKERIGGQYAWNVHLRFADYEGARVLVIQCASAKMPAFLKDGSLERFYVRYGPSTQELTVAAALEFIRQRF